VLKFAADALVWTWKLVWGLVIGIVVMAVTTVISVPLLVALTVATSVFGILPDRETKGTGHDA
jgi:hypothetical protein